MKMKKLLALLTATLLCGACAFSVACDEEPTSESSSTSTSEQVPTDSSSDEVHYTVTLDKSACNAAEDSSFVLTATVTPFGAIKWTTDNPAVASVSDGKVLCKQVGTANITASCGTATASCTVTVTAKNTSFTVLEPNEEAFAVEKGGESVKAAFTAYTVSPNGEKTKIEDAEITYEIGNEKLITLVGDEMKAIKGQTLSGTTTVTASYGDMKTTANVTAYDAFVATATEWNEMIAQKNNIGKYYLLTEDIDFSSTEYSAVNMQTSAATAKDSFRGTVEGNGHAVKNVTVNGQYASLFGLLYGAKIRNISFENIKLSGNSVAGFATGIAGTTELENLILDATFVTEDGYVIANECSNWSGKFVNSIVKIAGNAKAFSKGNVSQFADIEAVYLLSDTAIPAVEGMQGYLSAIDMAWGVNGQKKLPLSAWEYQGGASLPNLIKK